MALSLDQEFGIHEKALSLRAKRTEILASNLANADTPNYKAKDFDFKAALGEAAKEINSPSSGVLKTNVNHLSLSSSAFSTSTSSIGGSSIENNIDIKFRNPLSPSTDGNTVEVNQEQAAFSENALQYQVSLSFLSSRIQNLMTAIKGE